MQSVLKYGICHGKPAEIGGLGGGRTFRDHDRFSSIILLNLQL